MPVGALTRPGIAGEKYEGTRLGALMPALNFRDGRLVPDQHAMQPLAQQALGQLRITAAGAHEIRQRADDRIPELRFHLEQGLRGGGQADALAIELGERLATCGELGQRLFGAATGGAGCDLRFLEARQPLPRLLQPFDRAYRRLRLRRGALSLRLRRRLRGRRRLLAGAALRRCPCRLLAQLPAFPLEQRALGVRGVGALDVFTQLFVQEPDGIPCTHEALTDFRLQRGAAIQLGAHRPQVGLGGGALRLCGVALPLGLRGALLILGTLLTRPATAFRRVREALGGELQVTLEPSHRDSGVGQPALDFGPRGFRGMAALYLRLALPLRVGEALAGRGHVLVELARDRKSTRLNSSHPSISY